MLTDWHIMCKAIGFCDTYYKNKKSAPEWMDEEEVRMWNMGSMEATNLVKD